MARWTQEQIPDQTGRIAIVTGANSGIGYEAALELARKGAHVVLACRSAERGDDAAKRIRLAVADAKVDVMRLDLNDLEQVATFSDEVHERFDRLDLLINNAGVMIPPYGKTAQGFELQIGVNHLAHFALTGKLLDLLRKSDRARIVNVASMAHKFGAMDFEDMHWENKAYKPTAAYGQSKLANLLFTFELQRRLEGTGVTVTAAHPGWTATNLQRHTLLGRMFNPLMAMPVAQGALPTLFAATEPSLKGGEYVGPNGFQEMRGYPKVVGCSDAAKSVDDAERLFTVSETLTGVVYDQSEAQAA